MDSREYLSDETIRRMAFSHGQSMTFDTVVPKLAIRCNRASRSFVVQEWIGGKTRRATIARFVDGAKGDQTTAARIKAAAWKWDEASEESVEEPEPLGNLREVATTVEQPAASSRKVAILTKSRQNAGRTFKVVADEYIERRIKEGALREVSARGYRWFLGRLVMLHDKPISNDGINRFDLRDAADAIRESSQKASNGKRQGHVAVRQAMTFARAVWRYEQKLVEDLKPCPLQLVEFQQIAKREGRLEDDEIPLFVAAMEACPKRDYADMALILLFTGLRQRTGARELQWSQVDREKKLFRFAPGDLKGKFGLELPYSDRVAAILDRRWQERQAKGLKSKWVFPAAGGYGESGHRGNPAVALAYWETLGHRKIASHDLRRSYAGIAAEVLQPFDVAVLLDHRGGGQTFDYAGSRSVGKMRRSVAKVAARFDALLAGIKEDEAALPQAAE